MNKLCVLAMLLASLNRVGAVLSSPAAKNPTAETTSQITWNWTDPNNTEEGYRVYDAPTGGNLLQTLKTNSTSWTETGLTAGSFYTRYVCAFLGAAETSRTQLPSAMACYAATWHPTNSLQAMAVADTYIASGLPEGTFAFEETFRCGYTTVNNLKARRAMVQFDESALPARALWRAGDGRATLSLYVTGAGDDVARDLPAHLIQADWDETNTVPTWNTFSKATNGGSPFVVTVVGNQGASYSWRWDPTAIGMPAHHRGLMLIADSETTDLRHARAFASKDNTNGYPMPMMSLDYYLPVNPGWVTQMLVLPAIGGPSLDTATYATSAGLTGDTDLYGNSTKSYGGKTWTSALGDTTDAPGFSDHYGWNLNGSGSPFNIGVSNCALFNLYVNSSTAASDCCLRCGSDDGVRLIVNGTMVGTDNATRGWDMEQSVFGPFNLNAGWNRVLLKVRNGASNAGLKAVRFCNADATVWSGSTLSFAVDDTAAPGNPTACIESGGATSAAWQSQVSAPGFAWSGAADAAAASQGASGIRGYKVYFGPSASATPTAFQSAATFAPGAQAEGTYYLRVSTLDNAMNESAPATLFAFQYDHTPPTGVSMGFGTITPVTLTVTGAGSDALAGIDAATGYSYSLAGVRSSGQQGATYTWSGLVPNTAYTNLFVTVSDRASNATPSAALTKWTLSLPPAPGSVLPDNASPCAGSLVGWTATGGFGAGAVEYYRYAWDQSAVHPWTGTETRWSGGTLALMPTTAGTWYLHLTGYNGEDVANGSYDYALEVNALPVPQNKTLTTTKNQPATITTGKLLAGASGASSVAGVLTSTPGAAVSLAGGIVTYTPPADFTGSDTFTFTLASSAGCSANGTVTVAVGEGNGQSPNAVYTGTEGNQFVARFAGIPGESYTIEAASAAGGPWVKLGTNITVPATDQGWGVGVFEIRDQMSNGGGFYRTVWPAY